MKMTDETPRGFVQVDRQVYSQSELDDDFGLVKEEHESGKQKCAEFCAHNCTCKAVGAKLYKFFPVIEMIRNYKLKEYLFNDLVAGLTLGIVFIPQGMGFALLAETPAYYGLYASFWPVLFYVFFGTSRHMNIGAMAVISLFIGSVVQREIEPFQNQNGNTTGGAALSEADINYKKASIACAVSLLIGIIQVGLGVLRLGAVMRVMSTSFISGFTTGAGVHILTSQFKYVFGLKLKRYDGVFKIPLTWYEVVKNIEDTNVAEITIAIVSSVVLLFIKEVINERFKKKLPVPIPGELLVMITSTILSYYLKFSEKYDVTIIGKIPKELPAPTVPSLDNASNYAADAFFAAIVSFAISAAMAKIFARQYKYPIDANQEMMAYGISHVCSSFFWSFAGAAAPTRCFIRVTCGGKTQVASLISCALILLVIFFFSPYLESLPNSVLGAVILVALIPLFKQAKDLKQYWKINKSDCAIWIITFLSTAFLDVSVGLGIGIAFSIFTIVLQGCFVSSYTSATKRNTGIFVSTDRYPKVEKFDDIMVFKYDSNLYFTTASDFKEQLLARYKDFEVRSIDSNLGNDNVKLPIENLTGHGKQLRVIVIDCSAITYIDIMGLDLIKQVHADFESSGVKLVLASCNWAMQQKLFKAGLYSTEDPNDVKVYASVHDAVEAYSAFDGLNDEANSTKL